MELFQSTLPVWGATANLQELLRPGCISIHAPRVGSDSDLRNGEPDRTDFNPRSPCGERPPAEGQKETPTEISIHAPRVGSDDVFATSSMWAMVISIHAPRVGSDNSIKSNSARPDEFQSTLPVWGATLLLCILIDPRTISIHAPRVGSDNRTLHPPTQHSISIHAPRVGSDPAPAAVPDSARPISIHAPRVGSDSKDA